MENAEKLDALRTELAHAEDALDAAADAIAALPWLWRRRLQKASPRLTPEWLRKRARDATLRLVLTTPPVGTGRRWADVAKD